MFLCRIHDLRATDWHQQPGPSSVFEHGYVSIVFLEVAFERGFQIVLLYTSRGLGRR